jgi:D-alanyl-D-alanine carboxypeptidase
MRAFLTIVFGGLALVALGLSLALGAGALWRSLPAFTAPHLTIALDQKILYTADEEEDLVNSAVSSLKDPHGAITAPSYIVRDLTTGETYASADAERLRPIASLTKLVTAEVARRTIPESRLIPITPAVVNTFGNTADLKAGEKFTAGELMYPLLMVSSNDAAEALARSLGRAKFLREMNNFAQEIGAYRTYFDDPSGLSPQNVSTATDVAIILDWIRAHDPELLGITLLRSKTIGSHTWVNPTHFLSWSYYLGGKNGFTDEAKRTGASLFALGYKKDTYAIVVLGSDNRDEDVIRLINKVK